MGKKDIEYCFSAVSKAIPANKKRKPRKTRVGDIIMVDEGNNYTVTGYLPQTPSHVKVTVCKQVVTVVWTLDENPVLPISSFLIRWRPKGNPSLDSFDNMFGDDELWDSKEIDSHDFKFVIHEYFNGMLHSDTDFEVEVASGNSVGFSKFSRVAGRTEKRASVASSLLNFYFENKIVLDGKPTKTNSQVGSRPWEIVDGKKPWELTKDTLFLGFQTHSIQKCTAEGYEDDIAVLIVDVVSEYEPEISTAHPEDEKARIIMFVGETGSGKTTQINAFVSFLLGGDLMDSHHILLIDDRNLDQTQSINRYITVYRVRFWSDRFVKTHSHH